MKSKKKTTTFYIVLVALFSALVFLLTYLLPIPIGVVGFVNFGDALIFISGIILGPVGGAVAGAVGSSLADILLGYIVYAPFTFFIKGVEGFLCGLFYCYIFKKRNLWLRRAVSMLIAGAFALIGYFFADWILYGFFSALPNCLFMLLQVSISTLIALFVLPRTPELFDEFRSKMFKSDDSITVKAKEIAPEESQEKLSEKQSEKDND